MKIALLFKSKVVNDSVIKTVKNVLDGAEYFPYLSIDSLIKESNQRRIYFDRIIMADSAVGDSPNDYLGRLSHYISEESDKTQILLVCKEYTSPVLKVFKTIFNSPLYVAIVPPETSAKEIKSFITDDIQDLALHYFNEAKFKAAEKGEVEAPKTETKKSSGLFAKKDRKSPEERRREREAARRGESVGNSAMNENSGSSNQDSGSNSSNYMNSGRNISGGAMDNNSNMGNSNNDGFGVDRDMSTFENEPGVSDEMLDLLFDNPQASTPEVAPVEVKPEEPEEEESDSKLRKQGSLVEDGDSLLNINDMTQIVIFIGERGVGVTSLITDLASELYSRKESVLIVDLDYIRNGILSNIDVKDFYARGKESGIDNKNPYQDEEVDIVSNGYAFNIQKQKVRQLLTDRDFISNYDRILIDCPLDCVKSTLSYDIVNKNSIYVVVKGDLLSISATTMGLTDKSIESTLERYIAENCTVYVKDKMDTFEDDLAYAREVFYFSNGNWLNKIS